MELILAIILGLIIGGVIGWLASHKKQQSLIENNKVLQAQTEIQNENFIKQLETLKQESQTLRQEALQEKEKACKEALEAKDKACKEALDAKDATRKEMLAEQEIRHKEAMDAQKARFDEMIQNLLIQVKSATDDMLKQRQKEFAETSNTNLGQIVTPLRETIDKMKQAMNENTLKQTSMSAEMKTNIEHMIRQSAAAQKSAEELTRVFKHGNKIQGDWGETVLDELLETQGLTRGIHYDVQCVIQDGNGKTIRTEEGNWMRPDVILHLDQRREVIIDSKVSLTAFMDYVNAETEDERKKYLDAHIKSINKHVEELSKKDYSSYIQPPKLKMDYVIMFVPHTGALWTALNVQPNLWRKAMEKNVFIADEQTLFAALRIINLTWTQITQVQNHEKVYALANEMIDRVGQFIKKYQAIGKALDNAKSAYEDGEKKLQPNGQSILQTCGKLIKLGAKQSDRNPIPQLTDIDSISDTVQPMLNVENKTE